MAFIGLGANLGSRQSTIESAIQALGTLPSTQLLRCSSLYSTEPVNAVGPDYLNAVVMLQTQLDPHALLSALQAIENAHGRERPHPNAPRTLDLDLLLYGETCIQSPVLQVPHPRLHERAFVLHPLAELAPNLVVPQLGLVTTLLLAVSSQRVSKLPPSQLTL